jgi:hypothetical protein
MRCMAIRLSNGGWHHEHITYIWDATGAAHTRAAMVKFVADGGRAYVQDARGNKAYLRVRTSSAGNRYVQTVADGIYTDNLLALPRR